MRAKQMIEAVVSGKMASVVLEEKSFPWHVAAEADEAASKAYLRLTTFKNGFDQMEEIPKDLMPLYNETVKAIDTLVKATQQTNQVREMAKRLINRYQ